MKKYIFLFIFMVAAIISVNAQNPAKEDSVKMVQAVAAQLKFQEAAKQFQPHNQFLQEKFVAQIDSFYHVEQIKIEQPYQYTGTDGKLYVKDMYKEKTTKKPYPINEQTYNAWLQQVRLKYNKKE